MVVGPIVAVRARIGAPRPVVKGRVIDEVYEVLGTGQPGSCDPHPLGGERSRQPDDIGDATEGIEKAAGAGQKEAYIVSLLDLRRQQLRINETKPPRMHQVIQLNCNVEFDLLLKI